MAGTVLYPGESTAGSTTEARPLRHRIRFTARQPSASLPAGIRALETVVAARHPVGICLLSWRKCPHGLCCYRVSPTGVLPCGSASVAINRSLQTGLILLSTISGSTLSARFACGETRSKASGSSEGRWSFVRPETDSGKTDFPCQVRHARYGPSYWKEVVQFVLGCRASRSNAQWRTASGFAPVRPRLSLILS